MKRALAKRNKEVALFSKRFELQLAQIADTATLAVVKGLRQVAIQSAQFAIEAARKEFGRVK